MDADSKIEGLLHSEELALHNQLNQSHCPLADVVNGHKASKEEAPAPSLQEEDPLHKMTTCSVVV